MPRFYPGVVLVVFFALATAAAAQTPQTPRERPPLGAILTVGPLGLLPAAVASLPASHLAYEGRWRIDDSHATAVGPRSRLYLDFTASRVFLVLDGALAHIETRRQVLHEAGDHTIVLGRVVGGDAREGQPLMYFRGGYAALR